MKRIALVILSLIISSHLYPQKKAAKEPVTVIQFELFGRRGRTEMMITSEFAISKSRSEKKFIPMTADKWNALLTAVNHIDLPGLQKLKAPTSRRDVDGALHCRILICTKNEKYESQYFDSGIPMKQLQALYDKIEAIRSAIKDDGDDWKE
ncbi:MAG: hypothetical protein IPP72_00335 [Chitinophagaceae bacterium]|nr:hypothetical protein [Chitinophagaceae bacterium]